MHAAASKVHANAIKMLITQGTDVYASTFEGMTPIHTTGECGHDVSVVLEVLGANVNGLSTIIVSGLLLRGMLQPSSCSLVSEST